MSYEDQPVDDQPVLDTLLQMSAETYQRSGLDPRTYMMVRFAALAAVNAPPLSYLTNLSLASETGLSAEDVQATLVAIAPIIGGSRVVSSVGNIGRALGISIAIAEDDDDAELADAD